MRVAGYNLALLELQHDPETSLENATQLTRLHPLYANGWSALGNGCMRLEEWGCATHAFSEAYHLEPFHPTHQINLGSLHYQQGQWSAAIKWLESAQTIVPENQYIHQGLQAAHQRLNTKH